MKDFSYEVTERLAIISQSADGKYTLELNRISYSGRPAKPPKRPQGCPQGTASLR